MMMIKGSREKQMERLTCGLAQRVTARVAEINTAGLAWMRTSELSSRRARLAVGSPSWSAMLIGPEEKEEKKNSCFFCFSVLPAMIKPVVVVLLGATIAYLFVLLRLGGVPVAPFPAQRVLGPLTIAWQMIESLPCSCNFFSAVLHTKGRPSALVPERRCRGRRRLASHQRDCRGPTFLRPHTLNEFTN